MVDSVIPDRNNRDWARCVNTGMYKDIEKLEADLWEAADNLRANSKLTSSDYFMPVLGVIFLRHAANRFDAAHRQIAADQAGGKMPKRKVLPADYIARRSLYLPEKARFDWIMQQAAISGADLPKLVTEAMTAIEDEFEPLLGVLPKDYGIFETKVLEDLMRQFNSEQIKQATGDVFGRIYAVAAAKLNIGAWPPVTTMASNLATSISPTRLVSSTSALRLGVWMNPWLMRSVLL
jgi:type I restriction enzyme M protein